MIRRSSTKSGRRPAALAWALVAALALSLLGSAGLPHRHAEAGPGWFDAHCALESIDSAHGEAVRPDGPPLCRLGPPDEPASGTPALDLPSLAPPAHPRGPPVR